MAWRHTAPVWDEDQAVQLLHGALTGILHEKYGQ